MRPNEYNRRDFLVAAGALAGSVSSVGVSAAWSQETLIEAAANTAAGARGVAATVHPMATQAAIDTLKAGGNAIDAVAAAAWMLAVVDGHNSGVGGGGFLLARLADGSLHAIDGRETAPKTATADMFIRDGKADTSLSQTGPLASGVPGMVAALRTATKRFGKIDWNFGLEKAANVAEAGFPLDRVLAARIRSEATDLRRFPASAAIFLSPDGSSLPEGAILKQTDLAQTLSSIAGEGAEWFYRGGFADAVEAYMKSSGGLMRKADLADYKAIERPVLRTQYRDKTIIGFPPPSSGGIHVAQMLNMLEQYDVAEVFKSDMASGVHLILEVMKRAFADRAYWLGDADFADVPRGLIDKRYAQELAASIDLKKATEVLSHGQPPTLDPNFFGKEKHTTHFTVADAEGNWAAMTATVNTTFGSKVIIPGTGVMMNNEMDDFSVAPGVPNAFGLIGAKANAIAPGKRPLSSMSPSIVLDSSGSPILSCGAAGGPKIISAVLQTIVRCTDLGMDIGTALREPRFHHQWFPNEAVVENQMPESVVAKLKELGHQVKAIPSVAVTQGIGQVSKEMQAASDPRVPSSALGF